MNTRRKLLVALSASVLATPLASFAQQQPTKIQRIGFLCAVTCTGPLHDAFRQGLRDLGYVEGQNIIIEPRFARGEIDRLPALAAELVRLKVDVVVADGTAPARAAQSAIKTIPIVMAVSSDAVEIGLVSSLARPGGNITGSSLMAYELHAKSLELLKEALPGMSRVGVLLNPDNPRHEPMLKQIGAAVRSLGLQLHPLNVRGFNDVEPAFSGMTMARADAFLVLADTTLFSFNARIASLAQKNRLPSISMLSGYAEAGGLMTYGPDMSDLFRRAATYVDKILKGTKVADLPVERPQRFELAINLKTATALGIKIPRSILVRADKVIQ